MQNYSVLMSVYSKEKASYLQESIQSVFSQTVQTDDFVIVCDGELTEELDDIIEKYNNTFPEIIQIKRLPQNVGLGAALNEGLVCCKNEIVARMDSDDIAKSNRCEEQLKMMAEKNLDIISSSVIEFQKNLDDLTVLRRLPENHDDIIRFSKRRCPFNHPSVMFKKSRVLKVGSYKSFHLCEDYYLWIRLLADGAVAYNVQEPLLFMRAGENMYKRRSGFKYLKSMISFRWYIKKTGYSGWLDFMYSCLGQALVSLVPNKIRIKIYEKKLRKRYH